jgi:transposase
MEKTNLKKIEFQGLPIIKKCIDDLGLKSIFEEIFPQHGNQKTSTTDCILIMISNIILGRSPLYKIPMWADSVHLPSITGSKENVDLSDDRLGRVLDQIQKSDHGSLITKVVQNAVQVFNIDLSRLHNDSTSIKSYGQYPEKPSSKGLTFKHGHSKDHRPDLKQILLSLSITEDGMIPLHYKCYNGNVTDDKTHIETWEFLRNLSQKNDFWYIADSKACTEEQLHYITSKKGKVITIMPKTWKEANDFTDALKNGKVFTKKEIYRRPIAGSWDDENEYFSLFDGDHKTTKSGYRIHWIYSSEKKKRDRESREKKLAKTESLFANLLPKINRGKLKNEQGIKDEIEKIIKTTKSKGLFRVKIDKAQEKEVKQIGKGRPGENTKYKTEIDCIYSVSLTRNNGEIKKDAKADGVFPLLAAGGGISGKAALLAYKKQPNLEKKFSYLKSVHEIAPIYLNNINRIEALMLLYFLAIFIQSLAERSIRQAMKKKKLEELPLYPENRDSYAPTTNLIMQNFNKVCAYRLEDERGKVVKTFKDELSDLQIKILELIGLSENKFWGQEFCVK